VFSPGTVRWQRCIVKTVINGRFQREQGTENLKGSSMNGLREVFIGELREICDAEQQWVHALSKVAKGRKTMN
jgi:hypothetical protein